jgi:hypothetical protein
MSHQRGHIRGFLALTKDTPTFEQSDVDWSDGQMLKLLDNPYDENESEIRLEFV